MIVIWIFIAGGAGSVARYLIGQWAVARYGVSFPIGTLVVNLVGCFALGALTHLASTWSFNPELRAAITIGFIGGFTTYSSFNHETIALLTAGSATTAAVYVTVTLAGGLAAGWLGLVVSRQLMA